jgi:hypothetical protein
MDFVDRVIVDTGDAENAWHVLTFALQGYTQAQQNQIIQLASANAGFSALENRMNELIRTLDDVADNTKATADAMGNVGQASSASANQIGISVNAYYMLKQAMMEIIRFGKEAVIAAGEQEKADFLLQNSLRQAGEASHFFMLQYKAQALAIQETTGFRQEEIEKMQQLLIQLGVAPDKLDKVTKATLDLSAATGQDLFQTALMLGKAEEGVITALQRHGIIIEKTADKTKILDEATAKIEERFGGSAQAAFNGANRDVTELGNTFHMLSKSIGEVIDKSGLIGAMTYVLDGWRIALDGITDAEGAAKLEAAQHLEMTTKVALAISHEQDVLADLQRQQKAGAVGLDGEIAQTIKNIQRMEDKLDELSGKKISFAGPPDDSQALADAMAKGSQKLFDELDRREKRAEEHRQHEREKWQRHWDELLNRFEKHNEEFDIEQIRSDAKQKLTHDNFLEALYTTEKKIQDKALKEQLEAQKKHDEEIQREEKKVLQAAKQIGEQLLNFTVGQFTSLLTVNSNYSDQYNALQDKRTQSDLAEMNIHESLTQVAKERESQEAASREAALANILADIAQQATVKALFTAAEATADLFLNPAASATLFAASGMYAAVAAVAGGAAYAVTSSRGMTTEEASTLRGMQQHTNTTGATDVGGKTSGSGGNSKQAADTIINVYQLGIAGATKAQQADELAAIQKQYDKRRMGKG